MSGDDVPAERVEPQLRERPLDNSGGGFSRPAAAELPFGREGDAGDAGTAVAGRLSDEQQARRPSRLEVRAEAPASELGAVAVPVEVERRADLGGSESADEPFGLHSVTMLMLVRGRIAAVVAACAGVCATNAYAAPPQGFQSDAAFAASYGTRKVSSVAATTQRVSCYTPEVLYGGSLGPSQGYPDGGSTPCAGAATTGELLGPFPSQDVSNPPLRVKDFSESDLHVDPTNPQHLIGVSKWFVNVEGYNHLTGFYESYDGGATWPQQGHIPGYEGWTDNSDPVGAFDPWGNFYAVVLPYMFSYLRTGQHFFLSPDVNPMLPRSGMGIAVRPRGAPTPASWNVIRNGALDLVARTPFNDASVFDKQWIAIDTNPRSRHFGRVYVSWAIGTSDAGLRIYVSYADARRNGTHTNWSPPRRVLQQTARVGDNGSLPRVTPDGRVWLAMSSTRGLGAPYTMSYTSSRDGGRTWARRRVIVRHDVNGYKNTTFRAAFGEAFNVGTRKVGRFYPLYAVYENSAPGGTTTLFLRASFDGGAHWRRPVQVNDNRGAGEALQPNIAVAPNGRVAVAFYDRRLPCPSRDTPEATIAGLLFDPGAPFGRINYCVNTAVQFYTAALKPLGHNIRVSPHTWDPQLSSPRPECICSDGGFIGDYFGVDSRAGFTYTTSVETYNATGENPGYHQQQLVSKLRTP
jgi:BNR repeat protein